MISKPDFCSGCVLNNYTTGYIPLERGPSTTLIVGEFPSATDVQNGHHFSDGTGSFLNNILAAGGINRKSLNVINTIGCSPGGVFPTDLKWKHTSRQIARDGVEYCRTHHLQPAVELLHPAKIITLGDAPLQALSPRKGSMVWRGSALPLARDLTQLKIVPTLSPSYLLKDMKLTSVVINDLRKPLTPTLEHYNLYATTDDLRKYKATTVSFDFEWDWNGNITLCGLTDRNYHCTVTGWFGAAIEELRRLFENVTDLIGHNIIGADTRHFEQMKWNVTAKLHDTMLKQHLVQPDFRHGLGFVGSVLTNKMFWKGNGKEQEDVEGNIVDAKVQWKTWNTPDAIPRELGGYGGCTSSDEAYRLYNARDTDGSYQANTQLDILLDKYNLTGVYWNVSVPIAHIARDISDCGIAIDTGKVKEIRRELGEEILKVEQTLPEGLKPYDQQITKQIPAPPETFKPRIKECRGRGKNAHDTFRYEFQNVEQDTTCPICKRVIKAGKLIQIKKIKVPSSKFVRPWNSSTEVMKYAVAKGLKVYMNRKRGTSAADVNARKGWGRTHSEFRIIDKLKDLNTECNNFAKDGMKNVDRLFFNLLVHGTSEGRFASSGKRKGIDPNIQNQPKSIRKIYIPDTPDDCFIELDYASGENMLTAWLAQDLSRLERLRSPGFSEHLELAKAIFKLPPDATKKQVSDWEGRDLYDIGKHINHGSNYGMTHVKLKEYCEGEGYFFTEAECKQFIITGKELNPGTALWQRATIEMAKRDGWLRNVFGRMRWFSTRDVATKSLAFLPASTLADIIIRAMIGHYPSRFPKECEALGLQRVGDLLPGWRIAIQVHDSLVLHGPHATWEKQAYLTKAIMTQPWRELQQFNLEVETKAGGPGEPWGLLKVVNV